MLDVREPPSSSFNSAQRRADEIVERIDQREIVAYCVKEALAEGAASHHAAFMKKNENAMRRTREAA